MRRIPLILGLLLITRLLIRDVYGFFVTDEGIRYYASEPRRLLYVMLLAVAGGLVTLCITWLSPRSQRVLKLASLGTFLGALIVALGLSLHHAARLLPLLREAELWALWAAALSFVAFLVMAVLVAWELHQTWRSA